MNTKLIYPYLTALLFFSNCTQKTKSNSASNGSLDTLKKTETEMALKSKIILLKASLDSTTFYVVCANHVGGWCSKKFESYDDAKSELDKHKTSTGHEDNTVSNDCPFGN